MQSSPDTGVAKARACANCARAKARCVSQVDDVSAQQCTRCFRLKKECVVQPKPPRKKRAPNTAGIAELQSKLDSLVNLLSPAQAAKLSNAEDHATSASPEGNSMDLSFDQSENMRNSLPPRSAPQSNAFSSNHTSNQNGNQISVKSPDELLQIFRDQFGLQSPYKVISYDVTADQLREKQPWLYRIIMMAASSHERKFQIETAKLILSELSAAMITEGERSLDMLQALLINMTWFSCFSTVLPHAQSSGCMQLIIALVYDLALNRGSRFDAELAPLSALFVEAKRFQGGNLSNDPRELERAGVRSLDECRALLYAFYISSTFSTCIRKADGLHFSPCMDYSCKMLKEAADCEADLALVACSRFQSIADSVYRAGPTKTDGRNAPIWMHTNYLQTELQRIYNDLAPEVQGNATTRIAYNSVEIFLAEAAIEENWSDPAFNSRRIDLRWRSLMASKSLLDVVVALPSSAYQSPAHITMAQLGFCLMNTFKNSFIEDLGWDTAHARETVNLSVYFEQFASRLEEVGTEIDNAQKILTKESFAITCARAMRWVKARYDSKVASASAGGQAAGQQQSETMGIPDDAFNANSFDYMADGFWDEIMADFNFRTLQQFG